MHLTAVTYVTSDDYKLTTRAKLEPRASNTGIRQPLSIGQRETRLLRLAKIVTDNSQSQPAGMPLSSATTAPQYAPLTDADFRYHVAACLRDSVQWTYRQARTGSPSHPLVEIASSSLPTQFHELLRRVRRAHLLRRAAERAESTTGQTPVLRRAVARRRRALLKKSRKDRKKNFVWGRRLDRIFNEVIEDCTLRKSPYAVLAELHLRGVKEKGLTTATVKARLKSHAHIRRMKGLEGQRQLCKESTEKKRKTRREKICAMLPDVCREKPTLHLDDELMCFDPELPL